MKLNHLRRTNLILVMCSVFNFALTSCLYVPTLANTSWSKLENISEGYTITYPSLWYAENFQNGGYHGQVEVKSAIMHSIDGIVLVKTFETDAANISEFGLSQIQERYEQREYTLLSEQEDHLNTIPVIKRVYEINIDGGDKIYTDYYFRHGGNLFIITTRALTDAPKLLSVLEEIADSFELITPD